ncbi:MAG: hypothetical protein KAJ03_08120, partial [Gammaproteobacteria bacterium]|nr:hypothetical protein [Gammaproteobacteria bacterium]
MQQKRVHSRNWTVFNVKLKRKISADALYLIKVTKVIKDPRPFSSPLHLAKDPTVHYIRAILLN